MGSSRLIRSVVLFVCVFAVLQLTWQSLRGSAVERFVIHDMTLVPAAGLANRVTPGVGARAEGSRLTSARGGINILNGCEGMDAMLLLVAAFAAAPLAWRSRLAGAGVGTVVVFAINQARILVLFYAYRSSPHLFDALHAFVTPIAVVLLVAMYFHVWLTVGFGRPPAPA